MSLFLDKKLKFEKRAGLENRLNPDTEKWSQEIASVLHRTLPFLTNYAVNIQVERADNERGYGYGSIKVSNKYETPNNDKREISIPIIIKDRMLKPFDIMVLDGTTTPITEEAVREYLFQTSPVEITSRKPVDRDITQQYFPPTGNPGAYGNIRGKMVGPGGFADAIKMGQLKTPKPFANYLLSEIQNSQELQTSLFTNTKFASSVERILDNQEEDYIKKEIEPSVVQIIKTSNHKFKIKWANNRYWQPEEKYSDTKGVFDLLGNRAYEMNIGESITLLDKVAANTDFNYQKAETGSYSCILEDGNTVDGTVTKISNFDGTSSYLFFGPYGYCIKNEFYGKPIETVKLAMKPSLNFGVFYNQSFITEPVTIEFQEGNIYHCKTAKFNEPLRIAIEPLVKNIVKIGNQIICPEVEFIPIIDKEIKVVEDWAKTAAAAKYDYSLAVTKIGSQFLIEGAPVKNLSNFLDKDDAEFLLGGFGVKAKLANLKENETLFFNNVFSITLAKDVDKEATKTAKILVDNFDLARDLIKEAAILPDQDSVDTVLSLGMITPDNINQFISGIPDFEECLDKISELLLYSRLGLSELPESALENCIRNLLDVIKGLKLLRETQLL